MLDISEVTRHIFIFQKSNSKKEGMGFEIFQNFSLKQEGERGRRSRKKLKFTRVGEVGQLGSKQDGEGGDRMLQGEEDGLQMCFH